MKLFVMRFLCFISVLLFPILGFAKTQAYLITLSPGIDMHQAFGHSGVLIEQDGENTLYEYGFPQVPKIGTLKKDASFSEKMDYLQKSIDLLRTYLREEVPVDAQSIVVKMHKTGVPYNIVHRYVAIAHARVAQMDALNLTEAQVAGLRKHLDADIQKGTYVYKAFTDNCVTRIRNYVFSAEDQKKLQKEKVTESLYELSKASIDEAIRAHSRLILPREASQVGLPRLIHSTKQLEEALTDGYTKLKSMDFGPMKGLHQDFYDFFFRPEIKKSPISRWEAMFLPIRLREALIDYGYIDAKQSIRVDQTLL